MSVRNMKGVLVVLFALGCGPRPSSARRTQALVVTPQRQSFAQEKTSAARTKVFPGRSWEKVARPEDVGWSSSKLEGAKAYSREVGSTAVMIVEGGRVVEEWGATARRINLFSVRKSFLSALYGVYVAEGKIDLASTLGELGIDDHPPRLNAVEKRATVRELLQARSGVYHAAAYEAPRMKALRPRRYSHAPGTFWYYNNWDFNALGTIFERQTRRKIGDAFKERIAAPTGMEDFRAQDVWYEREPSSIHAAYPFRVSARDAARFGLLYLRGGEWQGREVIPAAWVAESTRVYSVAGGRGGYGYLWWVAADGKHLPGVTIPDGSYSARGSGGQYILVIPEYDLVIVHRFDPATAKPEEEVTPDKFGPLVKLILDARPAGDARANSG
ncbi:MAG TPA: serine hydrolase [Pyrinomonadaceae bacterium]